MVQEANGGKVMLSLTNGHKSFAVAVFGMLSLGGVLALVLLADGDSKLVVAAFTFLCSNVTTSMGFLTGSSAPDQLRQRPTVSVTEVELPKTP